MSKVRKEPNICESGGIGRRARLRGVWLCHTGSIPVSRTKKQKASTIVLAFCFLLETTNLTRLQVYALELGSHFCRRRSLLARKRLGRNSSPSEPSRFCGYISWCEKRGISPVSKLFFEWGSHFRLSPLSACKQKGRRK